MMTKNNGDSKKIEDGTCRSLSALSSSPYSFVIRLTSCFEAFGLKDNCNNLGSIWFKEISSSLRTSFQNLCPR